MFVAVCGGNLSWRRGCCFHGLSGTGSAALDSRTDAAAVLTINMDLNAMDLQLQEADAGKPARNIQEQGGLETSTVDDMKNTVRPEQQGLGAANEKVSKHT